jgi:hypothetical protein
MQDGRAPGASMATPLGAIHDGRWRPGRDLKRILVDDAIGRHGPPPKSIADRLRHDIYTEDADYLSPHGA